MPIGKDLELKVSDIARGNPDFLFIREGKYNKPSGFYKTSIKNRYNNTTQKINVISTYLENLIFLMLDNLRIICVKMHDSRSLVWYWYCYIRNYGSANTCGLKRAMNCIKACCDVG